MTESVTGNNESPPQRVPRKRDHRRARTVRWIGVTLVLLGLGVAVLRVFNPLPNTATGDQAWQLRYSLELTAIDGKSSAHLHPPWDTEHVRLFAQNVAHPGFRLRRVRRSAAVRDIAMLATRNGPASALAVFDIHVAAAPFPKAPRPSGRLSAERREALLAPQHNIQSNAPEIIGYAQHLAASLTDQTTLVDAIFDDVRERLKPQSRLARPDALGALNLGPADALARARLMVALCRASDIPARVVTGFMLGVEGPVQPIHWLQVLEGSTWQPFDPERGHTRTLPSSYLPVRLGSDSVVDVESARAVSVRYDLQRTPLDARVLASAPAGWHEYLDFGRLPYLARSTLALLMLLPLAVACTLAARRLLGVRSFGTFSPALLGLAATALDWRSTVVVFVVVIVIAGAGRAIAPHLRLARELRLGVVFLFVALGMAYGVLLLEHGGHKPGEMVLLLPIVVLTMIVDRFYTVADEDGLAVALRRLIWTVVLSAAAFAILLNDGWGHWLVLNPLVHSATLGLLILLGTYRGRQLSQTPAWAWLGEARTEPQSATHAKQG